MLNRGYSSDLSCRPSQRVLLNVTFFFRWAVRVVGRQAFKLATRNEDIVTAFSPPQYCGLFAKKKVSKSGVVTGTPGPPCPPRLGWHLVRSCLRTPHGCTDQGLNSRYFGLPLRVEGLILFSPRCFQVLTRALCTTLRSVSAF